METRPDCFSGDTMMMWTSAIHLLSATTNRRKCSLTLEPHFPSFPHARPGRLLIPAPAPLQP